MTSVYYPAGHAVLAEHPKIQLTRFSPCRIYPLNVAGVRVLSAVEAYGNTVDDLCAKLGLISADDINRLVAFLEHAEKVGILTQNPQDAGQIVYKRSSVTPPLERIFVEVTARCNLQCAHCYVSAGSKITEPELHRDEIVDLIWRASALGAYRLDLTGGEIFMRPDIQHILEQARQAFMVVNLFTNGTLISPPQARFLKTLGNIDTLYISLDDIDPEAHDTFRGKPGAFTKTLSGIEALLELGLRVVLNVTLTQANVDHVEDMIAFAQQLKVGYRFSPIVHVGRGEFCDEEADGNKAIEALKKVIGTPKIHGKSDTYGFGCGVGHRMLFIRSNGEICLCPTMTSRESSSFNLGQLGALPLHDLWEQAETLVHFRQTACHNSACQFIDTCRGGCRSRAFIHSGSLTAPDPVACALLGVRV